MKMSKFHFKNALTMFSWSFNELNWSFSKKKPQFQVKHWLTWLTTYPDMSLQSLPLLSLSETKKLFKKCIPNWKVKVPITLIWTLITPPRKVELIFRLYENCFEWNILFKCLNERQIQQERSIKLNEWNKRFAFLKLETIIIKVLWPYKKINKVGL